MYMDLPTPPFEQDETQDQCLSGVYKSLTPEF